MSLEIRGTRTDNHLHVSQRACNQATVGQLRDTKRKINVFLDQVHHPIDEQQLEIDVGIGGQKLECDRLKVQPPEPHGGRNREQTFRGTIFAGRGFLRFPQFIENPLARGEEVLTDLG